MFKVTEKYAEKVERLKEKRARVEAKWAAEAQAKFEAWEAKQQPNKKPPKPTPSSRAIEAIEAEALAHMRDL